MAEEGVVVVVVTGTGVVVGMFSQDLFMMMWTSSREKLAVLEDRQLASKIICDNDKCLCKKKKICRKLVSGHDEKKNFASPGDALMHYIPPCLGSMCHS